MRVLLHLYGSYLKSALLVMAWASVTLAGYALIRSSAVAQLIAAVAVSGTLSLLAALLLIEYVSPSQVVRRVVTGVLDAVLTLLSKLESRAG